MYRPSVAHTPATISQVFILMSYLWIHVENSVPFSGKLELNLILS